MFDIKVHGKWIALSLVAVPIVYMSLPPLSLNSATLKSSFTQPVFDTSLSQPALVAQQVQMQVHSKPVLHQAVLLPLDTLARDVIAQSQDITMARLQSQIEAEKAKGREAKRRGVERDTVVQSTAPVLTTLSYSDTDYYTTTRTPAIERITLNGLVTVDNKTHAYLALDDAAPVRVQAGDSLARVRVTHIDAKQVTLRQNKTTRTLGGL